MAHNRADRARSEAAGYWAIAAWAHKVPLVYLGRFERLRPNQLNLCRLTLSSKAFIPAS